MKKTFYSLLIAVLLVGFTTLSYAEMVVSLKQNTDAALPKIKVDIQFDSWQRCRGL